MSKKKNPNYKIHRVITALIFVGIYLFYEFITRAHIVNRYLFPLTNEIVKSFQHYWREMLVNAWYSFELLIPALLISAVVAFAVGIPMGLFANIRDILHPVVYAISVIPVLLLSPFALYLAPSFRMASLFLIAYGSVWALLFSVINGIMTIDKRYLDNAATLELTGVEKFFHVILPAASPSIVSGFITSVRSAFVTLVFAEMYGTKYGMGYFVKRNADLGRFEHVWSGFIWMVIVLVTVMAIVEAIKSRLLHWTID
ncbi:ABC transporter permease subunit [Lachnospiraceae bacterium KGMB03038]|nr:ABC transporter permease subunit [Lachnospiraceae bacterium KGMB03038]